MNLELVVGIVGGFLALVAGSVGWSQIKKHGRELADRELAERSLDEANRQADALAASPLSAGDQLDVLDRVSDD